MDEDAKALARVEKLLRLAGNNANEEEARTAAIQAVRLIQQRGFQVRGREAPRPVAPATVPRRRAESLQLRISKWVVWGMGVWWLVHQMHC